MLHLEIIVGRVQTILVGRPCSGRSRCWPSVGLRVLSSDPPAVQVYTGFETCCAIPYFLLFTRFVLNTGPSRFSEFVPHYPLASLT